VREVQKESKEAGGGGKKGVFAVEETTADTLFWQDAGYV